MYNLEELQGKTLSELEVIAKELGVKIKSKDTKQDIAYNILDVQAEVESSRNPMKDPEPHRRTRTRIAILRCWYRYVRWHGSDERCWFRCCDRQEEGVLI